MRFATNVDTTYCRWLLKWGAKTLCLARTKHSQMEEQKRLEKCVACVSFWRIFIWSWKLAQFNTKSKPFLRGRGPFKLPSSNTTLETPGWKAGLLPFPHGLFGAQALCDLEFIQRMGKVLHPLPQHSTNHRTFAHFLISPINVLSYPISVKL